MTDTLEVSVTIKNSGTRQGEEVVQLYIQDLVGSITRPVKELKGFRKISLQVGESKSVVFKLTANDLRFYHQDLKFAAEKGLFKVMVGTNSASTQGDEFELR